jgi:DNA-binding response OmpR family regulator
MTKDNLVLLVEDDADTREVMALLLDAAGYQVLSARDAKAGIRLMDEQPDIDVIVTDVNIGGGQDGISMAEELRRRGSNAAVVVISGDPEASSDRLGPTATFLPKPYDRKALLAAIADARARNARACAIADGDKPPYPGLSR